MIKPSQIYEAARKIKNENEAFLAFLRLYADPEELDRQFLRLHEEVFSGYDCCQCGNCCRVYALALGEDETGAIADFLGLSAGAFAEQYLQKTGAGSYIIESPCPFLLPNGKCMIYAHKPAVCNHYPGTDQPYRKESLVHLFSIAEECPVVYEIIERLKAVYPVLTN